MIDHTGASPVTYYIHTDQLGRPQKMTNASANLVWDAIFQPFGEVYAVSGTATNYLMFAGQFYDGETQLSQNWHRDYDPTIGRYIQSDPIGLAGGINTYSYASQNPALLLDPYGLYDQSILEAAEAAAETEEEVGGGPENPYTDIVALATLELGYFAAVLRDDPNQYVVRAWNMHGGQICKWLRRVDRCEWKSPWCIRTKFSQYERADLKSTPVGSK